MNKISLELATVEGWWWQMGFTARLSTFLCLKISIIKA